MTNEQMKEFKAEIESLSEEDLSILHRLISDVYMRNLRKRTKDLETNFNFYQVILDTIVDRNKSNKKIDDSNSI